MTVILFDKLYVFTRWDVFRAHDGKNLRAHDGKKALQNVKKAHKNKKNIINAGQKK